MLSLLSPIYQNQQLGHMMIKHPDRRSLLGPKSQHCCMLQLDLIALLSLGYERKKRRLHWQVPLASDVTRAEESGMSHILWVCLCRGLVVHFIKTYPLRWSWTFLRLSEVLSETCQPVMSWYSSREGVWQRGHLLEGNSSFIQYRSHFLEFGIFSNGNNNIVVKW